jgi:serine/threonine-protein kinase
MPPEDASRSPVPVGTVLADKYVVEHILGVGGMGVVVAARHRVLDQRVALKFLHGEALSNVEYVQRFIREARAAVKLESQFAARVSDVGVLESGSPYIVMELLEGQDLAKRIEAYPSLGPLPVTEAIDRILEGLDAIAEAHSQDIVHRDLKPANLFLATRADGSVATKVLDFGISKMAEPGGAPASKLTSAKAMLGTPSYMAPEQVRSSATVDLRADIWAMGVVLYEVLTGRLPFDGATMGATFAAILEGAPTPIRASRPEVGAQLEAVVLRCLEKDPERRFGDVAQLAEALAPFGSGSADPSVARAAAVLARRDRRSVVTGGGSTTDSLPGRPTTNLSFAQPAGVARPVRRGVVVAVLATFAALGLAGVKLRGSSDAAPVLNAVAATSSSASPSATPSAAPRTSASVVEPAEATPRPPPTATLDAPTPAVSGAKPSPRPTSKQPRSPKPPAPSGVGPAALPTDRL